MFKILFSFVLLLISALCLAAQTFPEVLEGSLLTVSKSGKSVEACPLKSTNVRTDISGSIARVRVTQEFQNNFTGPVEAVYTFPLSERGAVDEMTMTIGQRRIRGVVMKKDDAWKVYETAKQEGKTASLLDQDRPNVFTQSVANIMPGEKIIIEISYVESLKFDDGSYEFVFPMTVAPRYMPASGVGAAGNQNIPTAVAATRAGHDISIEVNINAGVPIESVRSDSHAVTTTNLSSNEAAVTLANEKTIPNKDFVLRYDVIGKRMEDAVLATNGRNGGFFSLVLSPPERMTSADTTPKEIVFVLDTSGSMSGFPSEKAKESMRIALDGLYPNDTFNLITFAGDTDILFEKPVPVTRANLDAAMAMMDGRSGGGGTEMMKAIKAALEPSDASDHVRIVCFMTDGEVGNDNEIIAEVQKHPKARVFSFGIGSSVNRYLLESIAREGRGEAEFVALTDDGSAAAKRFHERIRNPYLTDISIDWGGVAVTGVYPKRIPDLFGAKPIVIYGRYAGAQNGKIKLRGNIGGQPFEREIDVALPETEAKNDVLATLWARTKVDELTSRGRYGNTLGPEDAEKLAASITKLGVDYHLMTQYTSFVAVEERVANATGDSTNVKVPEYAPAGTVFEESDKSNTSNLPHGYIFQVTAGRRKRAQSMTNSPPTINSVTLTVGGPPIPSPTPAPPPRVASGGVLNGKAVSLPSPAFPASASAVNASGAVAVQVVIDPNGKVVQATAVSGHPLLRAAAEQAAMNSVFSPTMISGVLINVSGVITYNFPGSPRPPVTVSSPPPLSETVAVNSPPPPELSPEEKRRLRLASVMQFWLFDLMDRIEKGSKTASANDALYIRDGKALVEIRVTSNSDSVMAKLTAAGFETSAGKGKNVLIGRIAIERIAELALIDEVTLITPHI